MADVLPTQVDEYLSGLLTPPDAILDAAVQAGIDARMPQIQVSPAQGKFLYLLAQIQGAKRILEIGTLAGYSTIWLARALPPDGRLVSLELSPNHADVARANLRRAGRDSVADGGAVIDPTPRDRSIRGVRRMLELVAREPRLEATALQTVGLKGYDGFAILRVKG